MKLAKQSLNSYVMILSLAVDLPLEVLFSFDYAAGVSYRGKIYALEKDALPFRTTPKHVKMWLNGRVPTAYVNEKQLEAIIHNLLHALYVDPR